MDRDGGRVTDRIAIVGAGISGLTAAYLLGRRHEVVVYEACDYAGGHAHTVDVDEDGRVVPVDTGFLVYNRRNYPNFSRLLDQLAVATQSSDMSFSFRDDRTGFEYGAPEPWRLFAQPGNVLRPRSGGCSARSGVSTASRRAFSPPPRRMPI